MNKKAIIRWHFYCFSYIDDSAINAYGECSNRCNADSHLSLDAQLLALWSLPRDSSPYL